MRLATFIESHSETILSEWESFARTLLPAAGGLTSEALRDHAELMLHAVMLDIQSHQTPADQAKKSRGSAPPSREDSATAAETHGRLRAKDGFSLRQLIAEYRALRATVLRLWAEKFEPHPEALTDMTRFNEAIDQAIAESVDFYAFETEHWRQVFLGILGHDLRAPLHSMLLTAQLLQHNSDVGVSKQAAKMIKSNERMGALLDDLLAYSRISLNLSIPVEPSVIDLTQTLEEEVELQRDAWPSLQIELNTDGPTLGKWDAPRLRQVVGNLISNAAKYGDSEGRIVVNLRVEESDRVVLAVENSGPTIPAHELALLFEPLHRAARGSKETERYSLGLGLFIARQIVHAHAGEILVTSLDGRTVFTVIVPREFKNH